MPGSVRMEWGVAGHQAEAVEAQGEIDEIKHGLLRCD
jgi:hypothetical protein